MNINKWSVLSPSTFSIYKKLDSVLKGFCDDILLHIRKKPVEKYFICVDVDVPIFGFRCLNASVTPHGVTLFSHFYTIPSNL